ncbi:MAG: hypothetical protein ACOH1V_03915 [Stenotrophomonas sp.]
MTEIERLKEILGSYNHDPEHAQIYEALSRAILDAERYRWMRDRANSEAVEGVIRVYDYGDRVELIDGSDLDAAIDAAMNGANA